MSRDIPIIFSGPMVRALLDDRKTMTRRLLWDKGRPIPDGPKLTRALARTHMIEDRRIHFPTGWHKVTPGDRLWVRETAYVESAGYKDGTGRRIFYRATDPEYPYGWTPAIHMHRFASRLTLIVAAVKIERLNLITEQDAEAEGVVFETADPPFWYVPYVEPHSITACEIREGAHRCFAKLWNHIHGAESWDANPEVVALSFKVIKQNIDSLPKQEAA